MELKNKFILDACCGNRMMWINKQQPNTLYLDIRPECNPNIVGDFRNLNTFENEVFNLVVLDPPHDIFHYNPNREAQFVKHFGCLNPETWQDDLKKAFIEAFRVLKPFGVLIFKWNTHDAKLKKILPLFPQEPLFMNTFRKDNTHNSETIWFCFMKIPIANRGTNFTKSSADDFPYKESLISVKQDSDESQNPPANDERKKEADFV